MWLSGLSFSETLYMNNTNLCNCIRFKKQVHERIAATVTEQSEMVQQFYEVSFCLHVCLHTGFFCGGGKCYG